MVNASLLTLKNQSFYRLVQQKFVEPSQDYLLARYSGLQQNAKIPAKNFRLPLKGKVRTVRHRKSKPRVWLRYWTFSSVASTVRVLPEPTVNVRLQVR